MLHQIAKGINSKLLGFNSSLNLLLQDTKTSLTLWGRTKLTAINDNDKCHKLETHLQRTKRRSTISVYKTHRTPISQFKVSPLKYILHWKPPFGARLSKKAHLVGALDFQIAPGRKSCWFNHLHISLWSLLKVNCSFGSQGQRISSSLSKATFLLTSKPKRFRTPSSSQSFDLLKTVTF